MSNANANANANAPVKITVERGDWDTMERLVEDGVASSDDWEEFVDANLLGSYWPGFIYKNVSASVEPAPVESAVASSSGSKPTWRLRLEEFANPNHDKLGRFAPSPGGAEPTMSPEDRKTRDLIAGQIAAERARKGLKPLSENSLRGYAIKEHQRRQGVMEKVEKAAGSVKTPVAKIPIVGGTNDEKRAARREQAFKIVGGNLHLFGGSLNIVDNSWNPVESSHSRMVSQHLQDLADLPAHLINEFVGKGGTVWVGNKPITELHPALAGLKGRQPRGWPPGTSYDDVAGVYFPDGSSVVLGNIPGSRYQPVRNFAFHEMGHGFDHLRKKIALLSKEDRFTAMHNAFKTAAGRVGKLNSYYDQGGTPAGASEFFADGTRAWSRATLRPLNSGDTRESVVRASFSETGTYVNTAMATRMLKYFDGVYEEPAVRKAAGA